MNRHGIRALTHFRCSYRLCIGNKASGEQVELCSAVDLAFDELQLCDLTVGPRLGHRRGDGGPIGDDALAEGREDTAGSISDPGRQGVRITVAHQPGNYSPARLTARDEVSAGDIPLAVDVPARSVRFEMRLAAHETAMIRVASETSGGR